MKTKIGIVDDHRLFLKSLGFCSRHLATTKVIVESLNGEDLKSRLKNVVAPPENYAG